MTNDNANLFDPIHTPQQIYRKLLDAMSRPGTIHKMTDDMVGFHGWIGIQRIAGGFAMTVLDHEVSFVQLDQAYHVSDENIDSWTRDVILHTYAKQRSLRDAHFAFAWSEEVVGSERAEGIAQDLILYGKRGTLTRPDQSCTVFLGVYDLLDQPIDDIEIHEQTWNLQFTGPGIETMVRFAVMGLNPAWLSAREVINEEFPQGMDFVLFTSDGRLIAIPRTTRIEWEASTWHM